MAAQPSSAARDLALRNNAASVECRARHRNRRNNLYRDAHAPAGWHQSLRWYRSGESRSDTEVVDVDARPPERWLQQRSRYFRRVAVAGQTPTGWLPPRLYT